MTNNSNQEKNGFYGLGIAPKFFEILDELNFTVPTPIQVKSIPVAIEGKDLVGIAQTGTGKTLAFGVPILQRLAQNGGRGLVIIPTRELALQVNEHLTMIGRKLGLRTAVLIGGETINKQFAALRRKPHIIVATPGRLIDHLGRKTVDLSAVKILVLDEADMMFDMGFAPQIREVLRAVPKKRQTMLFSATMPPEIMNIAAREMALPVRIEVAPAGTAAAGVTQEMIIVNVEDKFAQVEKILIKHTGPVLVFTRTKHGAKNLCRKLRQIGHKSAEIHSNRSLAQRREALDGFKIGKFRILVATDIAARGIDVSGIELVLNYDLPEQAEDYVHRIGRTARAGRTGVAISLAMPAQLAAIKKIEKTINKTIPQTRLAAFPDTGISSIFNRNRLKFSHHRQTREAGQSRGSQPKFNQNRRRRSFSTASARPKR
ncbi:MAG: DEAD/DEAH box helicase [Candidatus Falkowbacteria bacterium]